MNLLQAMDDPKLFAPHFQGESWTAWRAFIGALFGFGLSQEQLDVFRECTGRASVPTEPCREAWLAVGRRGGKSRVVATIATFLATFLDWRPHLAPGEKGSIIVVAADRRQGRTILNYIRGLLQTPLLAPLVARETSEEIELSNNVVIEIVTCSWRTIRGRTVIACLADEIAFWRDENTANPDREVIAAIRPAMATIPNSLLLGISSPYAKRGVLYSAYRRYWGKDGPILFWKAPSWVMNPLLPQSVVDEAYVDDPVAAAAEFGAEFRSDIESFVSREAVEAVTSPGVRERPRCSGFAYRGFCDPSGGSSDSMTVAVAHAEKNGVAVLDATREIRPPFSPDAVVEEFSDLLKSYGVREVVGDYYGGEWPSERFRAHGITYKRSEKSKSQLYQALLPAINSGRVDLLDDPRLLAQLVSLERRTARGGRDSIDHPPNSHDDLANATAGALVSVLGRPGYGMLKPEVIGL